MMPLVLLHGWGSSPQVWAPLRAQLSPGREVLALPLPGHGFEPDAPADLDFWADAMLETLPARAQLCGWSLGGLLALCIARRAPERVERLVLIGATPCFARREDWACGLAEGDVERFRTDFERAPDETLQRFLALQVLGEQRRRRVLQALLEARVPATAFAHQALAGGLRILQQADLRGTLAGLALPVRVLHGAGDALSPLAAAEALADTLPEARLSIFDDCGHAPHLSRPEDCAALVESFLDE